MNKLRRILILMLLLLSGLYLGYEALLYLPQRDRLPPGATMGQVDVGGLTLAEAGEKLATVYSAPILLQHRQEQTPLLPRDVGFVLDLPAMQKEAADALAEQPFWEGYVEHLLRRPLQPIAIPLYAAHDREALRRMLVTIASFQDQPARPPQILAEVDEMREGRAGFVTDVDASLPLAETALYEPLERLVPLVITVQEAPPRSLALLKEVIQQQLNSFDGTGSIFIMDLQTGEELNINADKAISGLSILKIGIFVEAYRALDRPPNEYEQELFYDTAARSSNFAANLLLELALGERNTYRGALAFTESMRRLGLVNTFMAIPYDAAVPPGWPNTFETPANSQADGSILLDPTMQTTAAEIGTLLSMIYHCSKGGGALLAVYPGQLTPQECQAIIDLMVLNEEGNLIRFGVPAGTPVSHKHGWIPNTHADAGIVYTPGGDFVIVEYLHRPVDWLVADESFPILREIARAAYNYFNFEEPYLSDALYERDRFDVDDPFFQALDAAEEADEEAEEDISEGELTPPGTE
jgi:beta-lactamase class A